MNDDTRDSRPATGPRPALGPHPAPGPMMFEPASASGASASPREAAAGPKAIGPGEMDPGEVVAVIPDPPQHPNSGSVSRESDASVPSDTDQAAGIPRRADWALRGFLIAVVGVFVTGMGFDTADLLRRSFAVNAVLGWAVAGLCAGAVAGLLGMLAAELRGLARLRRLEGLRAQSERMVDSSVSGGGGREVGAGARFAASVVGLYAERPDMAPAIARLRGLMPDAHDDERMLRLVERELLAPLDARANRLTVRAARDTAVATALAPAAVVDMAIVMWRNLRLVRAIAALYGTRPGYLASMRLLRKMLGNLAVAGVADGVQHAAVDALGGSLAGAVSASLGKGVINGLLTARVGIAAMHVCRPLAFSAERRPSLAKARAALLGLPRDLL